jgi:hypothetical protein
MSHENEHERLDPGVQRQIERRLAALLPAPAQVDRDRLMFLAGMASVTPSAKASGGRESPDNDAFREIDVIQTNDVIGKLTHPARLSRNGGRHWHWPATTAALAATSLALLMALVTRPAQQPRIVYRDRVIRAAAQPQEQSVLMPRPAQANAVPITLAVHQRQAIAVVPVDNYVRTREVALRMGLDAIGSPRSLGGDGLPATSYGDWLQSLAGESRDKQRASGVPQLPNM